MEKEAAFEAQVDRIRASGCLGRSQSLLRVFDFLVEARRGERSVRESDLAAEVFGRDGNLTGDASVRVYVYRLRKKLEAFYASEGKAEATRLLIPLGEYRLELIDTTSVGRDLSLTKPRRIGWIVLAAALLGMNAIALAFIGRGNSADPGLRQALRSPVWSMIDGRRPVKLVVGDYYIFGEIGADGVTRMVREFDVNSAEDLQMKVMNDDRLQGQYVDLDTSYTATGSTQALQYILPVVRAGVRDPSRLQVINSSNLTPEMLKSDDIVYVGYLSALRLLQQPVFAGARLRIGSTFDDLVDSKTGRVFGSNAGLAKREAANTDYGYLRAFRGPTGNHIIVVAGTRDIGVLQMAETSVTPPFDAAQPNGVEALYEVRGIGRTNINARRIELDETK